MPDRVAERIIVCGGSECVICGCSTAVFFGPCPDCCEAYERTGKFPRRRPTHEDFDTKRLPRKVKG